MRKLSPGQTAFSIFNVAFLSIAGLLCILPFVNLLAVSLSGSTAVASGAVKFWPIDFTFSSYLFVMRSDAFIRSFLISIERVALGLVVNMLLCLVTAYPLSKSKTAFRARNLYAWYFIVTMLIGGGLIPWYMVIKYTGLIDSIWALILPGGLPVFSMVILLNFFRGLPPEIEEAAFIDGAGHWSTLWRIHVPLSMPSIATIALFSIVGHWNSWFDGLILMNSPKHYPLQSYLQTVIISPETFFKTMSLNSDVAALLSFVNSQTAKSAQLFVAMIPILCVYPLLQRYYTKGLVLGSVKG